MYSAKKKITIVAIFAVLLILGLFFYLEDKSGNPLNATYIIENQEVLLEKGTSVKEIDPGSASKQITSILWAPIEGDLNSDKFIDYAMIITQNSGGSGTFYYIAAGLGSSQGVVGTNGILLGDRISPENISIDDGSILVNYAERKADDPMTAQPSIGVSKYLVVKDGRLIEK